MTPDVNVLIAASRRDHPHHARALNWLETALGTPEPPLTILPMVASGFLRLATHPKVFIEPTPPRAAVAFMRAVLNTPGVQILALGEECPLLEGLCLKLGLTGNDIPDAWIAAAVQTHHLHLVTFDKGFRRMLKPSQITLLKA